MTYSLQVLAGLFLADLSAAVVHWFEDTYLPYDPSPTLLGWISRDNELHHYYPRQLVHSPWYVICQITIPIAIAIISLIYLANPTHFINHSVLYITWGVFGGLANQFHKWSHMRRKELPAPIHFLQRLNILCSHAHHACHHTHTPDRRYAVISPLTNVILDNLGIFPVLEYLISKTINQKGHRKMTYSQYHEHGLRTPIHDKAIITPQETAILKSKLAEYYSVHGVGIEPTVGLTRSILSALPSPAGSPCTE